MVGIGAGGPVLRLSRGGVYLLTYGEVGGSVMRGPHPALVVQSDRLARSSTVLVCPMTSLGGRPPGDEPPYLVAVPRTASGLKRDGYVRVDQIMTAPAAALGPQLGRLSPAVMTRVDASLRFVLGV